MRIVFVITRGDSIGGAQVHVRDLALRLAFDGESPEVITGSSGPLTDALTDAGVPWHLASHLTREVNLVSDLAAVYECGRILAASRPDLVSAHGSKAGVAARIAARLCGIPAVFTAHGWAFTEGVAPRRARLYRRVEGFMAGFADRIITVSEFDRRLALAVRVGRPDRIVTVHNGMPEAPAAARAAVSSSARPVRLIMIARFQEQKDHETLFFALSSLLDLDWTCELVGDGPLMDHYRCRASALGIEDRLHFTGQVGNTDERLAAADIFLLVSRWEGLPRSILEAMRAGLPVVASNVGGVGEEVAEGETGFLVPRGDAVTLSDRLRRLLADPDLRGRMGSAGRRRYEAAFTFERMYAETRSVWEGVLGEVGKRA